MPRRLTTWISTRTCCAKWVREAGPDGQHAFSGHGQMKPEQQEIDRLRKEVAKLKAGAVNMSTRDWTPERMARELAPILLRSAAELSVAQGHVGRRLPRAAPRRER